MFSNANTPSSDSNSMSSLSLIQKIMPAFNKQDGISEALRESEETVWLDAILRLKGEDVDIKDANLLERFKALLILQVHELFFMRDQWDSKHLNFLRNKIIDLVKNHVIGMGIISLKNAFSLSPDNPAMNKLKLSHEFSPSTEALKSQFEKIRLCEQTFYLSADNIFKNNGVFDKLATAIQNVYVNNLANNIAEPETANFHDLIDELLNFTVFKTSLTQGAQRFNINEIKKIDKIKNILNPEQVIKHYGFTEDKVKLLNMRKEYIEFHDKFIKIYNDTLQHIQQIFPDFTDEKFSTSYNKAFAIFQNPKNITLHVDSYLYELYLQQARKIHMQSELYDQLTLHFIPMANKLHKNEQVTVTISEIAKWMKGDKQRKTLPPSLHQIVSDAYRVLHSQAEVKVEEPEAALVIVENYSNELSTMPKQLFKGDAPGGLTETDLDVLVEKGQYDRMYQALFERLSKNHINNGERSTEEQKCDDKTQAILFFKEGLKPLTTRDSIAEIATLVAVAKPYINRHSNPFRDAIPLFKVDVVDSWKEVFLLAQTQALTILKNEFKKSPQETVELIQKWRYQSLFTEEYSLKKGMLSYLWTNKVEKPQDVLSNMLNEAAKLTEKSAKEVRIPIMPI